MTSCFHVLSHEPNTDGELELATYRIIDRHWPVAPPRGQSLLSSIAVFTLNPIYTTQPVVKPFVKPVVKAVVSRIQAFNRLSFPFDNGLDNRVWCLFTRSIQPVVNPVVQPVLTTGCIVQTGY